MFLLFFNVFCFISWNLAYIIKHFVFNILLLCFNFSLFHASLNLVLQFNFFTFVLNFCQCFCSFLIYFVFFSWIHERSLELICFSTLFFKSWNSTLCSSLFMQGLMRQSTIYVKKRKYTDKKLFNVEVKINCKNYFQECLKMG